MTLHPDDMERLGARLREIRKAHGLSQRQVGAAFGCYASNVSHIENGKSAISVAQLVAFSALVGAEPGALLTGLLHSVRLTRYGKPQEEDVAGPGEAA